MQLSHEAIAEQVRLALSEDLGSGDLTARLIPGDRRLSARIVIREEAVLCGGRWVDEVMRQLDATITVDWDAGEGEHLRPDTTVCEIRGPARPVLSGERTALNFLQLLSGTATRARQFVSAVEGTGARILDTRKTLPGLRRAQKYASACGGATNHRMGLFDAILIKENHIAAAGSIARAVEIGKATGKPVEVEVENTAELGDAMAAGADRVLTDNFRLEDLRQAVTLADGRVELEASGNVTLDTVRAIAETGVDYISTGAITKHVRAVDFSMRFR